MGLEHTTSSLGSWHSTAELRPQSSEINELLLKLRNYSEDRNQAQFEEMILQILENRSHERLKHRPPGLCQKFHPVYQQGNPPHHGQAESGPEPNHQSPDSKFGNPAKSPFVLLGKEEID